MRHYISITVEENNTKSLEMKDSFDPNQLQAFDITTDSISHAVIKNKNKILCRRSWWYCKNHQFLSVVVTPGKAKFYS
jgi:Pyruvate/2-oxoacid:ferredoxin oxidoreductase delta subunit